MLHGKCFPKKAHANKQINAYLVMQKVMVVTAKNPLANCHCSPYDEVIAKNATVLNVNFPISLAAAT